MKRLLLISGLLISTLTAFSADLRKFVFDFESWSEGAPPAEVFVVDGKFEVVSKDGNKALEIGLGELVDANALLGDSAKGSASIEARIFGTRQGRSAPRFALGVHGQSGYRLVVFPAKKELQLSKQEEIVKTVPFTWTSDAWLKVKLEVTKVAEDRWTISAKAWPATEAEPKEAQITHEDPTLKGQGKCSIWGTPYSNTPILFDDVTVQVE